MILWVIQSDRRKLIIKAAKQAIRCRLFWKSFGNFEKNVEKIHFLDILFQQKNAPVHKSKIIGKYFMKTSGR